MTSKQEKLIETYIRKKVRSMLKEDFPFNETDWLVRGITFEDLITAVQSNEQVIDERSIMKTFNQMVKDSLEDAKHELKKNMPKIIKMTGR